MHAAVNKNSVLTSNPARGFQILEDAGSGFYNLTIFGCSSCANSLSHLLGHSFIAEYLINFCVQTVRVVQSPGSSPGSVQIV